MGLWSQTDLSLSGGATGEAGRNRSMSFLYTTVGHIGVGMHNPLTGLRKPSPLTSFFFFTFSTLSTISPPLPHPLPLETTNLPGFYFSLSSSFVLDPTLKRSHTVLVSISLFQLNSIKVNPHCCKW